MTRRPRLALTFLLLAGPLHAACDTTPAQTWIVAGQSNADGRSRDQSIPHPLPLADGRRAWSYYAEQVLPTVDPFSDPTDWKRRPWPHFAAARLLRAAGHPWMVHTPRGNTCLAYADPQLPGEPSWHPDAGSNYARILSKLAEARALAFPPAAAVLWDQGACEAVGWPASFDEKREAYRDALLDLADAIGADLGVPLVAALVSANPARLAARPHEAEGFAAVRAAIAEAAALHPAIFLGPDQADPAYRWENDGFHVRSIDVLGTDWADAVGAAGL